MPFRHSRCIRDARLAHFICSCLAVRESSPSSDRPHALPLRPSARPAVMPYETPGSRPRPCSVQAAISTVLQVICTALPEHWDRMQARQLYPPFPFPPRAPLEPICCPCPPHIGFPSPRPPDPATASRFLRASLRPPRAAITSEPPRPPTRLPARARPSARARLGAQKRALRLSPRPHAPPTRPQFGALELQRIWRGVRVRLRLNAGRSLAVRVRLPMRNALRRLGLKGSDHADLTLTIAREARAPPPAAPSTALPSPLSPPFTSP